MCYKVRDRFHLFACRYPVLPTPFVESTVVFPLTNFASLSFGCICGGLFLGSLFYFSKICFVIFLKLQCYLPLRSKTVTNAKMKVFISFFLETG